MIHEPTRYSKISNRLIDNISTNFILSDSNNAMVIETGFSDHLAVQISVPLNLPSNDDIHKT